MLTIRCSACGQTYTARPDQLGQTFRCTACGGLVVAKADEDRPPAMAPVEAARRADEIDFVLHGDDMQFVEITLDPGEMVIAEAGAMMYMSDAIRMETTFGDPSAQQQGFFGKLASAATRAVTGESLFMTTFTNGGRERHAVAFAAPFPGKIIPVDLQALGGQLICQKDSFLCAARGVTVGIAFQKRIGVGLFGGEGFIMQRLTGDGQVFVHAGGTLLCRDLGPGEKLRVDTGCLVGLVPGVDYNIEFVGGVKNTIFGGEGLFLATLTGPGRVWLQSLPFSRLAARMLAGATTKKGQGEGSILGGLGTMVMGGE